MMFLLIFLSFLFSFFVGFALGFFCLLSGLGLFVLVLQVFQKNQFLLLVKVLQILESHALKLVNPLLLLLSQPQPINDLSLPLATLTGTQPTDPISILLLIPPGQGISRYIT